ncbi:MAG: DUF4815 domain-containing protein [Synergistaceae bacterium]|nr:DUF4815 domain-containing protein [Synergistaceae bacterium]
MTGEELKTLIGVADYYNRYHKSKGWDYVALLVGRATQAAEINEIQNILEDKTKAIGSSLYEQGMIIDGCGISYNSSSKKATLNAGLIFLDGLVYEVVAKELSVSGSAVIGVWKITSVLTHDEDSTLRNPALGYPEFRSPGAWRIITKTQWGLSTETHEHSSFCEVYRIDGGIITRLVKAKPNIARYDFHAHGNYAVEGLTVSYINSASGKQKFKVTKGLAHIGGYETEIFQDTTFSADEVLDGENITKEVTQSETLSGNTKKITLAHVPVERISVVRVTKQRTVTNLTHGSAGCVDELPDDSVTKIIEVKQGAKFYIEDTDFRFVSETDGLNWSLSGDEPTSGSKYDVTYQYRVNAGFTFNTTSVTVTDSDFLTDEPIDVTYAYRMPRKDIIIMREDSSVELIRGKADAVSPIEPDTPSEAIRLASVLQTWVNSPAVNNSVRSVQEQLRELTQKLHELEGRLNDGS